MWKLGNVTTFLVLCLFKLDASVSATLLVKLHSSGVN